MPKRPSTWPVMTIRMLRLRIFTSRLLGREPRLVLHGGGNTSVKTTETDLFGVETNVLRVKGSGWDLATIEPVGLPAVRLEPLLKLEQLEQLTDEAMVNYLRGCLMDCVGAYAIGGNPAPRFSSAQIHRSFSCRGCFGLG